MDESGNIEKKTVSSGRREEVSEKKAEEEGFAMVLVASSSFTADD